MAFNIVWEKKSVVVSFEGEIDTDEIIFANNKLCGNSKFDELDYQIFDFTDVSKLHITKHQAEMLASFDDNSTTWNTRMKVALVETNQEHIDEIHHYIELMKNTRWNIKHFENIEDALIWSKI